MPRYWAGCGVALLGGLLAGSIFEIGMLSTSYSTATWDTYWQWWAELSSQPRPELVSYPIGAALAGCLGWVGFSRWHTTGAKILGVIIASFIGAMIAVPGSVLFDCAYYGRWNMGCSGLGLLRLIFETPVVWIALLGVTTALALLARAIVGQGQRASP
jgi:hypothetical protein